MAAAPLPSTRYRARLWLCAGQAVYVGPSLGLGAHSGAMPCLAVALDGGTFTVRVDGTSGPPARSALIPPRLTHHVTAASDRMVCCFVGAGSAEHDGCQRAMTVLSGPLLYRHHHEAALSGTAGGLHDTPGVRSWLALATAAVGSVASPDGAVSTGPEDHGGRDGRPARRPDPRIDAAVAALHDGGVGHGASAEEVAGLVGLSRSRFLHLFRRHTGTSYRRYRSWLRMLRAAELIRDRGDLTSAAVDAGFASPSHFSDSFHATFGLRPRHLLGVDITVADTGPGSIPRGF